MTIHIAAAIIGAVLAGLSFVFYAVTAFSDPGFVERRDKTPSEAPHVPVIVFDLLVHAGGCRLS